MFLRDDAQVSKKKVFTIQWKIGAMLPDLQVGVHFPGLAGPLVGVYKDQLIVAGGANFPDAMPWKGGLKKYHSAAYVFKKGRNGNKILISKTSHLPFATAYGASCSSPRGIVYVGGENESGILRNVWLVKCDAKNEIIVEELPELPLGLANASVVYYENCIYVGGGETSEGVSEKFLKLDLNNLREGWKSMPPLLKPLSHFVMVTQSKGGQDCIYMMGGRKKNVGKPSDLSSTLYEFDLNKNKWSEKAPLPHNLSAGTGIGIKSSYILLFGGDRGETFQQVEKFNADIANEPDTEKKQDLIDKKNRVLETHPGFNPEVLMYNTVQDYWSKLDTIPFDVPVTTTACMWGTQIIIPSGEIKAGVRTPQILTGKLSIK